jgi:hypothetical protein
MTSDPKRPKPDAPASKPSAPVPPNGPRPGTDPDRDNGKPPPDPSYIPASG